MNRYGKILLKDETVDIIGLVFQIFLRFQEKSLRQKEAFVKHR